MAGRWRLTDRREYVGDAEFERIQEITARTQTPQLYSYLRQQLISQQELSGGVYHAGAMRLALEADEREHAKRVAENNALPEADRAESIPVVRTRQNALLAEAAPGKYSRDDISLILTHADPDKRLQIINTLFKHVRENETIGPYDVITIIDFIILSFDPQTRENKYARAMIEANVFNLECILSSVQLISTAGTTTYNDEQKRIPNVLHLAMEYQGYDPSRTLGIFLMKWNEFKTKGGQPRPHTLKVKLPDGNDDQITWLDGNTFDEDMTFHCMISTTRGYSYEKTMKKSTPEIRSIMESLKMRYRIDTEKRPPGTPIDPSIVIPSRMSGTQPDIITTLYYHGWCNIVFDSEILDKNKELDRALCSNLISSMIPNYLKTSTHVFLIILYVAIEVDNVLHSRAKERTGAKDIWNYIKAATKNTFMQDAYRVKMCKKWGLLNDEDTISDALSS
ncbi:hypothetical protein QAD02_005324 [Eretmocerus hayati]|uniref:Uncharacterized protein n=1 Tax=Eretmocerus hayati TaxID=131215 RepID=A0ACC2NSG3_9HYME|nr:hypothetical protein QAD02_005324 [Eretmocerus hayati]